MMTQSQYESKLISLIKPKEMSIAEYKIKCMIRGINASVTDPTYMHWVIDEAYKDFNNDLYRKARELIVNGLKSHYILDFTQDLDCSYMIELITEIVMREHNSKSETEKLFAVILEEYRDTKLGDATYHLNKGLGITSVCYFQ
mgnify:CR=1 FL=1